MKIAAVSALAIALLTPLFLLAVPKHENGSNEIICVTYAVADLPVWRSNLKDTPHFAPEVLIKYLQATVDPNSWRTGAEIRPFERNASLVIAQTQSNHEKIADTISAFRERDPREVEEVKVR
jgi:hypothetical protein